VEEYIRNVADTTQEIYQGRGNIFYDIKADFRLSHKYMLDLGIAINELITNALKYGPKPNQGDFTIAVTLKDGGRKGEYLLVVQDNGRGFSQEYLSHPKPQGTGIGTILMKSLAKQLQGEFLQFNQNGAVNQLRFSLV
jgi:two-component sensor histidine kinase